MDIGLHAIGWGLTRLAIALGLGSGCNPDRLLDLGVSSAPPVRGGRDPPASVITLHRLPRVRAGVAGHHSAFAGSRAPSGASADEPTQRSRPSRLGARIRRCTDWLLTRLLSC